MPSGLKTSKKNLTKDIIKVAVIFLPPRSDRIIPGSCGDLLFALYSLFCCIIRLIMLCAGWTARVIFDHKIISKKLPRRIRYDGEVGETGLLKRTNLAESGDDEEHMGRSQTSAT